MPTAKLLENDFLEDSTAYWLEISGDQESATEPLSNAYDQSVSDPGLVRVNFLGANTSFNGYIIRMVPNFQTSPTPAVPDFFFLQGVSSVGFFGGENIPNANVSFLAYAAVPVTSSVSAWVGNPGEGDVRITTPSAHGFATGDFVRFENSSSGTGLLTSSGGPTLNFGSSTVDSRKPWKIKEVLATTQFTVQNSEIATPSGNSSGTVDSNVITKFDTALTETISISEVEERNFFFDLSDVTWSGFVVVDYLTVQPLGETQISIQSMISGDYFIPVKNVNPILMTPINSGQIDEMENARFKAEKRLSRYRSQIEYPSLTKAEHLRLRNVIFNRMVSKDVIFIAFPGDTSADWESQNRFVGRILDPNIGLLIEGGSDGEFHTSISFNFIGDQLL